MDESNNDLAIRSKEGIELHNMVGQPKRAIDCFLCEEHFNSISNLDEHLLAKHQMDREKHAAYWKWQSNEISETQGKMEIINNFIIFLRGK